MSTLTCPKPGPRIIPDTLQAVGTAAAASAHARSASHYLQEADHKLAVGLPEDATDAATIAQAHALASLAWTNLNPPGRRERHTSRDGGL